jgi:hypothetical protein
MVIGVLVIRYWLFVTRYLLLVIRYSLFVTCVLAKILRGYLSFWKILNPDVRH